MRDLTSTGYRGVDLDIRPGDIVGLTGLLGSGRTELALTLFGLNRPQHGTIEVEGRPRLLRSPRHALEAGIALLPENRQREGLFMRAAISWNLSATILDQLSSRIGVVDATREAAAVGDSASRMGLHQPDLGLPASSLSGGNQQKVVIGKWVATTPRVLILDSPMVGVDVGSKAQIYERIRQLATASGLGVLLISEEIEELLATCNRVLVMNRGTIARAFDEEALASADVREQIRSAMEGEQTDVPVPAP
jgi:simple sugar transport system ATP-binding protein